MVDLVVEFDRMVPEREWELTGASSTCRRCRKPWSALKWKHHCRNCGQLVCNACSSTSVRFCSGLTAERCCVSCYSLLRALSLAHIHASPPEVEVPAEVEPVEPAKSTVQGAENRAIGVGTEIPPSRLHNVSLDDPSGVRPASPTELSSEAWLLYDESLKFSTDDASISEKALTAADGAAGNDAGPGSPHAREDILACTLPRPTKQTQSDTAALEVEDILEASSPLSPPELRLQRQLDCLTDEQLERLFSKLSKILYKNDEDWGACEQPERLLQEILTHPEEFFDKDGKLFCAT